MSRGRDLPVGVRVRYGIAIAASLIACVAAGSFGADVLGAKHQATSANTRSQQTAQLAEVTAALTASNTQLTQRVAVLAASNQKLAQRVATDERKTCVIQSRGLTAQTPLVGSLKALHRLLTFPPTRRQRAEERQIPRHQLHAELETFGALNRDLARYVRIVGRQPKHRSC